MNTPIVLVSGFGQTGDAMSDLQDAIAKGGYETAGTSAYDLAASCWTAAEKSAQEQFAPRGPSLYAAALGKFLEDWFPGRKVCLLGWSMGGMVALECAHHYPEKCSRLILAGSTARLTNKSDGDDLYDAGVSELAVKNMRSGLMSAKRMTLVMFYRNVFRPGVSREKFEAVVQSSLAMDDAILVNGLNYLEETDLRQFLPDISYPVLVLHGSEDRVVPPASGQYLAGGLPNSSLHIFAGQGHAFVQEAPAETAERVIEFLR